MHLLFLDTRPIFTYTAPLDETLARGSAEVSQNPKT
jgi:hypothetical protein